MEYYFFIIVIIVLKIMFWTFYFYVRAQRMRQARTSQRFIIVGAQPMGRRLHPCSDRSAIIDHAEPVAATGPPPYAEVVKEGHGPLPPSYDQAMAGTGAGTGMGVASSDTPVPTYNVMANSPHTSYPPQVGGYSVPSQDGDARRPSHAEPVQ